MATWLPTSDDPELDGVVAIVPARSDDGREGVKIALRPEASNYGPAFDAYYATLEGRPGIRILDRGEGWVVFEPAPDDPEDPHRFALEALAVVQPLVSTLTGLSTREIGCADGAVRLLPRWRPAGGPPPLHSLARYLEDRGASEVQGAIRSLLGPDATPATTDEPNATAGSPANDVKVTKIAPVRSRARLDLASPRAAVLIPSDRVAGLTPAQRSVAAGLVGLPTSTLDGLVAAGLPLVLEIHDRTSDAQSRSTRLARSYGLPVIAAKGGGIARPAFAIALLGSALVTLLAAGTFAAFGLFLLPLFGAVLGAGMFVFTARILSAWARDGKLLRLAAEAHREIEEERERLHRHPVLARAWSLLADARSALGTTGLPPAAASDLREVLQAAERELESLTRAWETVGESHPTATPTESGTESPLQERRERLHDATRTLVEVLETLTDAISRWETTSEDEALEAVLHATRRARQRQPLFA